MTKGSQREAKLRTELATELASATTRCTELTEQLADATALLHTEQQQAEVAEIEHEERWCSSRRAVEQLTHELGTMRTLLDEQTQASGAQLESKVSKLDQVRALLDEQRQVSREELRASRLLLDEQAKDNSVELDQVKSLVDEQGLCNAQLQSQLDAELETNRQLQRTLTQLEQNHAGEKQQLEQVCCFHVAVSS